MTLPHPKLKSTVFNVNNRVWKPTSLNNLRAEIDHISKVGGKNNSLILYRGQRNNNWPLDSTFVRNCISTMLGIKNYTKLPSYIRKRSSFHRAITSLLLMKFDKFVAPSKEAYKKEQSDGIDPFFELFKNIQQYPEKYDESPFIKGTNFIDWTNTTDIALYFATFEGKSDTRKISTGDGAIWAYDASSTGNILKNKVGKILDNMNTYEFLNGKKIQLPLMFHPQKQTNQHRASNQKPVYIAQMNFSFNLSEVWEQYEKANNRKVFLKIQIHEGLKKKLANHLESKGVLEEHVYPH